MTSFGKIEVEGPAAAALLDRVCVNRIDRPVGSVVYTQWCNSRGGIVADVTVTRLAPDRFRVVTGAGVVDSDLGWLELHRRDGEPVSLREASAELAVIGMWGPRARDVLQAVTADDVGRGGAALPGGARDRHRARRPVLAQRITYVGELGYELYVAPEWAVQVWDALSARRRRARHRTGRLPRARVAAHGEGLPLHGHRYLGRRHPLRGRARLLRGARQGRLRRPRRAGTGGRGPAATGAAHARGGRRGRPRPLRRRGGAARRADGRAGAQLRLRAHRAPQHRLCLPAGGHRGRRRS